MPRRRSHDEIAAANERAAEIVRDRAAGVPFARIAEKHGVSAQRTHQVYSEAMRRHITGAVGLYRAQISDLADLALTELFTIATDPAATWRARTEALNAAARWTTILIDLHGVNRDAKTDPLYASMLPPPPELIDAVTEAQAGPPLGTYTNRRQAS